MTRPEPELRVPEDELVRLKLRWAALLGSLREARTEAREARADLASVRAEVTDLKADGVRAREHAIQLETAYKRVWKQLQEAAGEAAYYKHLVEQGGAVGSAAKRSGSQDLGPLPRRRSPPPGRPRSTVPQAIAAATGRNSSYPNAHSPVWRQLRRVAQAEASEAAKDEAVRWRRLAEQRGEEVLKLRRALEIQERRSEVPGHPGAGQQGQQGAEVSSPWTTTNSVEGTAGSTDCSPPAARSLARVFASPTPLRNSARFQKLWDPEVDSASEKKARAAHTQYFNIGSPEKPATFAEREPACLQDLVLKPPTRICSPK